MKNKRFLGYTGLLLLIFTLPLIINFTKKIQNLKQNAAGNVSALIFGTNLTLNTPQAQDQFITSQTTRNQLKTIHVQMIRMPIRGIGPASAAEIQAMQDIHDMGVIPIIILKFTQPDPAGAAKQVIQSANNIFGNNTVYYEFGNERDLAGVTQDVYTNTWNQVISQLKSLSSGAKFGGPVNYQANAGYIAYFVEHANPQPDFNSWHEYTCGNNDSQSVCIGHIANWKTHIASIKSAIQANPTHKTVPPLFITEWNYDPNYPPNDPRATPQFQQQFTQTALQELANDGVTGAAHFVATGSTAYNLVDPSGQLTAEGQEFGQMYSQLIGNGTNLTPSPNPTPTSIPTTTTSPCISNTPVPTNTQPVDTSTPFPTNISPSQTPIPTVTLTPSSTPTLGPATGSLSLHFEGIDSINNPSPKHSQRKIILSFFSSNNFSSPPVAVLNIFVTFVASDTNGLFVNPSIDLSSIPQGSYFVLARSPQGSLQELLNNSQPVSVAPGQLSFLSSQNNQTPANMRMGDLNNDNVIDARDYNILVDCYGAKINSPTCKGHGTSDPIKGNFADLNDDGVINGIDYNILIRHLGETGFGNIPSSSISPNTLFNFSSSPCVSPTATFSPTPTPTNTITSQPSPSPISTSAKLFGVNVAGADFQTPQYAGQGYSGYSYYHSKNLTLIRLPFTWEKMEPSLGGPIGGDIAKLSDMINTAQSAGETVFIEPHNYARYNKIPLTPNDASSFAGFWNQLAQKYATGFPGLWGYELMNEPHDLSGGCQTWQTLAQAAVNAIRTVDTNHYILLPGYAWQSAKDWNTQSSCLSSIHDPNNKMYFSAHEYFDIDNSGTHSSPCPDPQIGVQRLQPFLSFLSQNNVKGLLTEYGSPVGTCWLTTLDNFMNVLNTDSHIVGGTYWAGGPFWGNYFMSIEPSNGQDKPQMSILQKYPSHN